jgi:hypothetical protein
VRTEVGHGSVLGTASAGVVKSETNDPQSYFLQYWIIPQPDWEYVVLQNPGPGPITLNSVAIGSSCTPIPSTTTYGVMLLVLLLAGTAVWIIRKRTPVEAV